MVYDLIIRGGLVVDGTGGKAHTADVAVKDGRIVRIGRVNKRALRVFDADGLIVTPGFIDVHTHYDAQVDWDPLLTPSSWNGVTTVLAGNCGFTLAPAKPEDINWLAGMLARVEGMSRDALNRGVSFTGGSFGDFWQRFRGRLAINVGSYVGHCAVRRYVMGDDASERRATPEELEAMKTLVRKSMSEGALGFSTSQLAMHVGEDGREVPSNFASDEEIIALCAVLADFDRSAIEFIARSLATGYDDSDRQLIKAMYAVSGRPIELGPIVCLNAWQKMLAFTKEMTEQGVSVHPMMSLNTFDFHVRLSDTMMFDDVPEVRNVLCLPEPARMNALRDPAVRATWRKVLVETPRAAPLPIDALLVEGVTAEMNEPLVGRRLGDIAAERDEHVIDCFVDLSLSENLNMKFVLPMDAEAEKEWRRVNKVLLSSPQCVAGSSDAGAHLNSFVGADYTTRLISEWVPHTLTLENAIYRLTGEPAAIHGLDDRGALKPGHKADIVCFDLGKLSHCLSVMSRTSLPTPAVMSATHPATSSWL
jgi:N-acyl-D-aspartate/D-glutamate deacylase